MSSPAPALVVLRVAEVPCHSCNGHGQVRAENFRGRLEVMTCWVCGGSGIEPDTALAA